MDMYMDMDMNMDMDMDMDTPWSQSTIIIVDCDPPNGRSPAVFGSRLWPPSRMNEVAAVHTETVMGSYSCIRGHVWCVTDGMGGGWLYAFLFEVACAKRRRSSRSSTGPST